MKDEITEKHLYRVRINERDDDEVWEWAVRLSVTTDKLRHAISRVGNWSDDVQFELNRQKVEPR